MITSKDNKETGTRMLRLREMLVGGLVLQCLGCGGAAAQSGWRMEPVPLQTRWAKEVSPANAWPEYPRPQLVRPGWVNLNGLWDYAITPKEAARPARFSGRILVPYPIESALSGVRQKLLPTKRLWYRRSFARPATQPGERVLLHFGAVDWQATVSVNGKEMGRHQGGYQAFSFDITSALETGTNELVVAVWDPTDASSEVNPAGKQVLWPEGIYYTGTSGIWQTVWLETVPAVAIAALELTPDVGRGLVRVRVRTTSTGGRPGEVGDYTVQAVARTPARAVDSVSGKPGEVLQLPVPKARLWSPADPFLYDLSVRLLKEGTVVDSASSYFGMRQIEVKKDSAGVERIFLNGQYTYNLGVLDQGYWPDGLYTAPTDGALRFDIEAIKAMGFNTIRKHIKVEPARWYYHADRLGMLVWQDLPQPKRSVAARPVFEAEADANIQQLYNHPSIVMWVLFNEGWGAYDQERLTSWLQRRDSTRLVNGHSGGYILVDGNQPPPGGAGPKWVASDVADIHAYPHPDIAPAIPGKARVLGEFGGVGVSIPKHQWNEVGSWGYVTTSPAKLVTLYDSMTTRLKQLEAAGQSGSIYTEPFDVETEENGLITYDRAVLKLALDTLRAMNARLVPRTDGRRGARLTVKTADSVYPAVTYATLLEQYATGRKDPAFVRALAYRAYSERDTVHAPKLSVAYLASLGDLTTPEELPLVRLFTQRSTDPAFGLFYRQGARVDSVMGEPGFAEDVVDDVITREEITPLAYTAGQYGPEPSATEPDWAGIRATIGKKYGARYADRTVARAQWLWYWRKNRWPEFHRHLFAFVKQYGLAKSRVAVNEAAWTVFEHSNDQAQLATAASWMERICQQEPDDLPSMDTHANLLYKLGRKADGIALEERVVALAAATKHGDLKTFQGTLAKMKRGQPTWPTP
jgi:hypothetical protein